MSGLTISNPVINTGKVASSNPYFNAYWNHYKTEHRSKSVFITTPWGQRDVFQTLKRAFEERGYTVYDWTSATHAELSQQEQIAVIDSMIRASSIFVLYNTYPADYAAASWTQWGLALSVLNMKMILIDPGMFTRYEEIIKSGRALNKGEQETFDAVGSVSPFQLTNLYGHCLRFKDNNVFWVPTVVDALASV